MEKKGAECIQTANEPAPKGHLNRAFQVSLQTEGSRIYQCLQ